MNKNIRPAQCLARETPFFIAALALSNLAAIRYKIQEPLFNVG